VDWIDIISNLGFPIGVALILLYFVTKQYRETQNFIQDKLVQIVENNTKALENLVMVINEMRHEIFQQNKEIKELLQKQQEILTDVRSRLK